MEIDYLFIPEVISVIRINKELHVKLLYKGAPTP